jgi:hypothetical protein
MQPGSDNQFANNGPSNSWQFDPYLGAITALLSGIFSNQFLGVQCGLTAPLRIAWCHIKTGNGVQRRRLAYFQTSFSPFGRAIYFRILYIRFFSVLLFS